MDDYELVQKFLLQERDRQVKKAFGFGRKEITQQFLCDLYRLPSSGGSDEREYAFRWLERSGNLFSSIESWQQLEGVFSNFSNLTGQEVSRIAENIRSKQSGRDR